MKITTLKKITAAAAGLALAFSMAACNGGTEESTTPAPPPDDNGGATTTSKFDTNGDGIITVGFAQTGSESGWRVANTQSFQSYFVKENGFELVYADADSNADKQKTDVRGFITQGVELIIICPLVEDGWEPILQEAKAANIPVVVADRNLTAPDDLVLFRFGGDMEQEGKNAVQWLQNYIAETNFTDPIKILHMKGELGSTAQLGRSKALEDAYEGLGWEIVYSETGKFSYDTGLEVMNAYLAGKTGKEFNVVYGENDDMVYGIVKAMEDKGLNPKDYIIISFDGNKSAVKMVMDGIIDVIAECTPVFADQIGEVIKKADAGEEVAKQQYTVEGVIDSSNAAEKYEVAFGV